MISPNKLTNCADTIMSYSKIYDIFFILFLLVIGNYLLAGPIKNVTIDNGGLISSTTRDQVITAIRSSVNNNVFVPKDFIRDMVISPDNARLYTVESDGYLRVYSISENNSGEITVTYVEETDLVNIDSPISLTITPDSVLAFVAGDSKIMGINVKKFTNYTSSGFDIHIRYDWKKVISTVSRNYVKIIVGPSGQYLYYIVDDSKNAPSIFRFDGVRPIWRVSNQASYGSSWKI